MTERASKQVTNGASRRPPNAGKGRKKGTKNKTTESVKTALTLAFQGMGGVPALKVWASENPTEFYKLWAKMLPKDMTLSDPDGQPLKVIFAHE